MTLPIVTEMRPALEPVDRDTFLDEPQLAQSPVAWDLPRRRPADA